MIDTQHFFRTCTSDAHVKGGLVDAFNSESPILGVRLKQENALPESDGTRRLANMPRAPPQSATPTTARGWHAASDSIEAKGRLSKSMPSSMSLTLRKNCFRRTTSSSPSSGTLPFSTSSKRQNQKKDLVLIWGHLSCLWRKPPSSLKPQTPRPSDVPLDREAECGFERVEGR